LKSKLRQFVNSNAGKWYHGPLVDKKAAETLLEEFGKKEPGHTIYLIRDCPQITKSNHKSLPSQTVYVFAISWIKGSDIKHRRIFLTLPARIICLPLEFERHTQIPKPVTFFGLDQLIADTLELSGAKPLTNRYYSGLQKLPQPTQLSLPQDEEPSSDYTIASRFQLISISGRPGSQKRSLATSTNTDVDVQSRTLSQPVRKSKQKQQEALPPQQQAPQSPSRQNRQRSNQNNNFHAQRNWATEEALTVDFDERGGDTNEIPPEFWASFPDA